MPQRTIYLSEADAALWDSAKSQIGEKSMSAVFVEHLRNTLNAREGFLHVVRAEPAGKLEKASVVVMFAPLDSPGGFSQPHYCQGMTVLAQFLRKLGLSAAMIESVKMALASRESVSERLVLDGGRLALFRNEHV